MNSRNGLVFLLLCLVIWTVYTEAVTSIMRPRRRHAVKTTRRPTVPTVANVINDMVKNGVKPVAKEMNKILNIIDPTGIVIFWKIMFFLVLCNDMT